MLVKMKTLACGPGGTFHPGAVREVSEEEGKALLAAGAAEDAAPKAKAPAKPEAEAAAKKARK